MDLSEKEIFSKTNAAISKLLNQVLPDPLIYFSEGDLQSLLYMYLYKEFSKPVKTKFQRGYESTTMYKTLQVHREYGSNDIKHSRTDLCFLSKEEIHKINDPNLKKGNVQGNGKEYLTPLYGIELGTEKTPDYATHIKNDIKRLTNLKKGYLIYIFKDTAVSAKPTGRGIKTIKKFETIKSLIKGIHESFVPKGNIIPLFFILQLQKKQNLRGKCKYFNFKTQSWDFLNLQKIEPTIKELLK